MIVYCLQPCPLGWSVLRNGLPLARYASAKRALEIARQMARRENERQGVETTVQPIAVMKSRSPAAH